MGFELGCKRMDREWPSVQSPHKVSFVNVCVKSRDRLVHA